MGRMVLTRVDIVNYQYSHTEVERTCKMSSPELVQLIQREREHDIVRDQLAAEFSCSRDACSRDCGCRPALRTRIARALRLTSSPC
jgi:hypothetical protein